MTTVLGERPRCDPVGPSPPSTATAMVAVTTTAAPPTLKPRPRRRRGLRQQAPATMGEVQGLAVHAVIPAG